MTHRLVGTLIEQLPMDSRTRTAIRDAMDPHDLAELAKIPRPGWGPHNRTDELLCRLGERLDYLAYILLRGQGSQPEPWRRPGVLSGMERAEAKLRESGDVIAQLESERAERTERRRARKAKRQQRSGGGDT